MPETSKIPLTYDSWLMSQRLGVQNYFELQLARAAFEAGEQAAHAKALVQFAKLEDKIHVLMHMEKTEMKCVERLEEKMKKEEREDEKDTPVVDTTGSIIRWLHNYSPGL